MSDSSRPPHIFEIVKKARETGLFVSLEALRPMRGSARIGALSVTGPDAAGFLNGQVTNEVNGLGAGEGNLSARVTRQGNLMHLFSLHRLPDRAGEPLEFMLLMERDQVVQVAEDLEHYIFAEEVEIKDVSDDYLWTLIQGPGSPAVMGRVLGDLGDEAWTALSEHAARFPASTKVPTGSVVFAHSLSGDIGFLLALPVGREASEGAIRDLAEAASEHGLRVLQDSEVGEAMEVLRIEGGLPRAGLDYDPGQRVLPETALEQSVVSYSKGCFLGQEVIARIRTYGTTAWALRGLVLHAGGKGSPSEEGAQALQNLPDPGCDLCNESGKKIGTVTSRSWSPHRDAPLCWAYLDRASRTPGTILSCQGKNHAFKADVVLLPFYHAPDRIARARFLHDRAVQVFADHKDELAIRFLEEAIRLDPSFGEAFEALGVMLGRLERFHEAIDIFKRLEEVAPKEPMVHTNLSLFYMKLGDKERAEDEKAKATVKQFGRIATQRQAELMAAEETQKRKADAERKKGMFQEVLEIDPEDPLALFGLGNALVTLEEFEDAESALRRAVAVQRDNSAIYLAHGKVLERLRRNEDALGVYQKGIEVASRKGDLMPLQAMEHRAALLRAQQT